MDEVYDKAIIAGKEYNFVSGTEKQIDLLITYFPNEEKAIRSYFEMIKGVSSGTAMFFGEKAMPPFLSKYIGKFLRKKFNSYSDKTTYDALRELNCSDELISVLCAQCGDYGLTPKRSSFAIQAMIASHYMEGGNYPVGGAQEIFKNILDVIHEGGGEVLIRADVKKIIIENKIAVGVEMENGDKIFATKIISNAGARNTFDKLIPDGDVLSIPMKTDLLTVKPSISHLCLYVGLNASDKELKLPKWNYWVYKSSDFDGDFDAHMNDVNKDVPLHYISFQSAKDSS